MKSDSSWYEDNQLVSNNKENSSYRSNISHLRQFRSSNLAKNQNINGKVPAKKEGVNYEVEQLKRQLKEEREKSKALEARTIQEQCSMLQHLDLLQHKFQQLSQQKRHLQSELDRMNQSQSLSWQTKYHDLYIEHKKIKNIADSMVDMMEKVQGIQGTPKQSWKWLKKVVWEYEQIRKKALQWKKVYDQVTEAIPLIQRK